MVEWKNAVHKFSIATPIMTRGKRSRFGEWSWKRKRKLRNEAKLALIEGFKVHFKDSSRYGNRLRDCRGLSYPSYQRGDKVVMSTFLLSAGGLCFILSLFFTAYETIVKAENKQKPEKKAP